MPRNFRNTQAPSQPRIIDASTGTINPEGPPAGSGAIVPHSLASQHANMDPINEADCEPRDMSPEDDLDGESPMRKRRRIYEETYSDTDDQDYEPSLQGPQV